MPDSHSAEYLDFGDRLKAAIDAVVAAKVPIPASDESLFEIETMDALRTLLMSKAKALLALVRAAESVLNNSTTNYSVDKKYWSAVTKEALAGLDAAIEALDRG